MAILFRKHERLSKLADQNSPKKVYPTITYKYSNPAKLKEVAKEISAMSGVSEGNKAETSPVAILRLCAFVSVQTATSASRPQALPAPRDLC